MTECSEYFSQAVKSRGLKCVEAAEICDIDTSVMFRWLNGRVLPKSWERLAQAAERLRLSPYEMGELQKAYRKEAWGEERSASFDEVLQMIQSLGEAVKNSGVCGVQTSFAYEVHVRQAVAGSGFLKLKNKTDVCLCIQNVLALMSARQSGRLFIKLSQMPEILLLQLKQLCRGKRDGKLEVIISGGSTEDKKPYKLERIKEMVALLLSGSRNQISCYHLWNAREPVSQNWVILNDIFLQFSEDMSQGMITKDAEWAAFFRESFGEMKSKCQPLERRELPLQKVGRKTESNGAVIAQEKKKGPKPQTMSFLQYLPYTTCQEAQYFSCFTKEGLVQYLKTGDGTDSTGRSICAQNKRERYETLRQIITLAEQEAAVHYIMLREKSLDLRGIRVICGSGADVSLCLETCPQDGKWEEIRICDADVRQQFAQFFACLPESGLAYGEAETLQMMKEMVEEAYI